MSNKPHRLFGTDPDLSVWVQLSAEGSFSMIVLEAIVIAHSCFQHADRKEPSWNSGYPNNGYPNNGYPPNGQNPVYNPSNDSNLSGTGDDGSRSFDNTGKGA